MYVEKYKKKKNNQYTVTFSNHKQMDLYEEVILKYELLLKKEIDAQKLLDIISYNQECDVYYTALKYLKVKPRSKKEVHDFLVKKEFPPASLEKAILKLEKQGYIHDLNYANSYLNNQLITTSRGPNKIAYELEKKGISSEIISQVLLSYREEIELEKIRKLVTQMIRRNRNKSTLFLKRKIEQDLLYQGFHKKNIEQVLSEVSFQSDQAIYQREYDRLYQRLKNKYQGDTLEYQIKQRLYQKGFRNED